MLGNKEAVRLENEREHTRMMKVRENEQALRDLDAQFRTSLGISLSFGGRHYCKRMNKPVAPQRIPKPLYPSAENACSYPLRDFKMKPKQCDHKEALSLPPVSALLTKPQKPCGTAAASTESMNHAKPKVPNPNPNANTKSPLLVNES